MMGRSHDEVMIEYFRAHPAYAASLVNDILEDGDDQGELKIILQHIAAAGLKIACLPQAPAPAAAPAARRKAAPVKTAAPARRARPRRPAPAMA